MTTILIAWIVGSIGFALGWAMSARMKEAEHSLEIEALKKVFPKTATMIVKRMHTDEKN